MLFIPKHQNMEKWILRLQLLVLSLFGVLALKAQDGGLDIDVDLDGKDTPAIFERTEFWIGVAVVLIIIAYILKRK